MRRVGFGVWGGFGVEFDRWSWTRGFGLEVAKFTAILSSVVSDY